MDEQQFLDTVGKAIREAAGQGRFKHDLGTPITVSTNLMHGPSGVFGHPGIERDVFATRVKPRGLLSILPARGTMVENPVVAYLTGFTDDDAGSEKSAVCDTPISAGEIKSCLQGAMFGRYERKTDVLELNAVGRQTNRGEFFDLRLVNDPILDQGLSVPGNVPRDAGAVLAREVLARWLTLGVSFERLLGPQVYTGSPVNNTVGGGYEEFHGLETLVGTGKIDVITSTACAALDSYIDNWNYARLDVNGALMVEKLTFMWRYINDIASRTGLDPAQFVLVMRRNLFHELSDIWPCAYGTYRCVTGNVDDVGIARVLVDGMAQRQMADDLRNGQYLLIDGVKVPVVVDDFIPEDTNTNNANVTSGCFSSDIYLLPLSVRGGILSLFWEYVDYQSAAGAMQAVVDGRLSEYWTDGGRFLWTLRRTGWCVEWWAKTEPRLRLLTPHLAGRIRNVMYCPIRHYREDEPSSSYFADGGVTTRTNTEYDVNDFPAAIT